MRSGSASEGDLAHFAFDNRDFSVCRCVDFLHRVLLPPVCFMLTQTNEMKTPKHRVHYCGCIQCIGSVDRLRCSVRLLGIVI